MPAVQPQLVITPQRSRTGDALIAYFYSGWAFLIPYLLTYLLYTWLKWPVNPSARSDRFTMVPCLLHVYWFLHAAHIFLGVAALKTWWQIGGTDHGHATPRFHGESPTSNRLWPVVPWLLLALIFWIPGVYLEWPSDPWEHLRRITEWSTHPFAGEHSAGYKSFYFFAYSFISAPPNLSRLGNVNLYGTCIDLLLAWQYFRLARAVGLNEKWGFLFVLVNTLTFGNVCFSFYKYYTLSSTMYSQLGAIALVRITIDFVQHICADSNTDFRNEWISRSIAECAICSMLLSILVACNHIQGLGIAGLGIASIIIWGLVKWKQFTAWWLLGTSIMLSAAAFLWWPRYQAIEAVYRPTGWLNFFYGFNLIAWPSPASDRAVQIAGFFGLLNLSAGLLQLRRQSMVGCLILIPGLALLMPFIALPIANRFSETSVNEIISFHRLLFAIPTGLGLVFLGRSIVHYSMTTGNRLIFKSVEFTALAAVLALLVVPSQGPYNNRTWNLLSTIPTDLRLNQLGESKSAVQPITPNDHFHVVAASDLLATATTALFQIQSPNSYRSNNRPISQYTQEIVDSLAIYKMDEASDNTLSLVHQWQVGLPNRRLPKIAILVDIGKENATTNERTFSGKESEWTLEGGSQPNFAPSAQDQSINRVTIENSPGSTSNVFTSDFISVNSLKRFKLQLNARALHSSAATAYLAVAWYDENHRFLRSDANAPMGAGNPRGWVNGIYSYFGLAATRVPPIWTNYQVSFGLGNEAAIPTTAKFFKIGALLNFNGSASAVVQLSDIRLEEKAEPIYIATWSWNSLITPQSLAAKLSGHWPVQQVALGFAGTAELDHVANRLTKPNTPPDAAVHP